MTCTECQAEAHLVESRNQTPALSRLGHITRGVNTYTLKDLSTRGLMNPSTGR